MSKIALTPNASGSGTFTIAAPNSDTDRTLTLPDEAGTLLTTSSDVLTSASSINGANVTGLYVGKHFFHAYRSTDQSLSNNTNTVAVFNTEVADVSSAYNTSTGKFTVPEDGLYFFVASAYHASSGNSNLWNGKAAIRNSGSTQILTQFNYGSNYPNEVTHQVSGILDCSTGDLIDAEVAVETSSGSGSKLTGGKITYFLGVMIA